MESHSRHSYRLLHKGNFWRMNLYPVLFVLLCFFNTIIATTDDPTHSTRGDISINCGSSGASVVRSGREWLGDVKKKISSIVEITGSSTTSTVIHHNFILDPVPYKTARLSFSQFSYAFRVNPGPKILRFHFNSAPYTGFKRYKDLFSVEAGPFTLLSNFSAFVAAHALGVNSFVKEYCINIQENQLLTIVFSPASSLLQDMYAFVNGIEIISIPAAHSYFHIEEEGVQLVGKSYVYVDNSNALEIIRRLNMKRDHVSSSSSSSDDTDDEFGTWEAVPKTNGNKVKSNTWKISVDVGFRYLVRLHFSRQGFKIAEIGGFIFEVQINGKIVNTSFDRVKERENDSHHWCADYMVVMKGSKQEGKRHMLIGLNTNDEFLDGHGPIKGFEILKLSNLDNSLASSNPMGFVNNSSHHILHRVLGRKNAIASGAVVVLVLLNVIVNTLWVIQEASPTEEENMIEEENMPSAKAGRLCRRFSLAQIHLATQNFSDTHLIGRGGFGKVYRGIIDNGQETVAIKRLKSNSRQGVREFLTEIETLTELRHVNLVSLIGYCNECKEMILVYEYMASGTLADHLFKLEDDSISSLTWKQRLNICIGAGRGLDYLHTGHSIIHRDIKASNILLDENFTAKVADFGLAKPLNPSKLQNSHVSTKVKGTFGYWDPEYLATGKLTRKSDTYSFGVVLLEVLSGRQASDQRVSIDEQNLTRWAKENISKGKFDHLVALKLRGEISDDSLKAFVDILERCLHDEPKKRPTMAEVVIQLQNALEIPESSKHAVSNEKSNTDDNHLPHDETESSTSTVQFKDTSEDDHILMPTVKEQFDCNVANSQPSTGIKDPRKSRMHKLSRLWPWGAFRNKEPSANNEILMSAPHVEAAMTKDKPTINSTPVGISSSPPSKLKDEFMSSYSKSSNQTTDMELIAVPAIPFDELKGMTGNFGQKSLKDEDFYHVVLKSGQDAALKVLKHNIQTDQGFLSQVSKLSSLKHRNLALLLGYSMDGGQRILAYEHAASGSLHDILHGRKGLIDTELGPVLSWTQRVRIAFGAAKGLEYLHDMEHVHSHLISSNILIFNHGEEVAKITDFHWPRPKKEVPAEDPLFYVIPREKAGNGYCSVFEPATLERDVYDFGVVLLELLTGRKSFDPKMAYLVKWVMPYLSEDKVNRWVDGRLDRTYPPKAVAKMAAVAFLCVQNDPPSRPKMNVIVRALQPLLNDASG